MGEIAHVDPVQVQEEAGDEVVWKALEEGEEGEVFCYGPLLAGSYTDAAATAASFLTLVPRTSCTNSHSPPSPSPGNFDPRTPTIPSPRCDRSISEWIEVGGEPTVEHPGAVRCFRTGDWGYWCRQAHGKGRGQGSGGAGQACVGAREVSGEGLHLVGRRDQQLKIGGVSHSLKIFSLLHSLPPFFPPSLLSPFRSLPLNIV